MADQTGTREGRGQLKAAMEPAAARAWSRRKIASRMLRISMRADRGDLVRKLSEQVTRLRAREIAENVEGVLGRTVQSGPFQGMGLPTRRSWGDGDLTPKILGCYEAQLHPALCRAIGRRPALVINIGCAEGFYAVGLARSLPDAEVVAFDLDDRARAACREAADANGVSGRVKLEGACTPRRLAELAGRDRALAVIDCEGVEVDMLTPDVMKSMGRCDLLIECHDFIVPGATETLAGRLGSTHDLERITEQARDPNAYPALHGFSDVDRALALCEFRPCAMTWLAAWSR